MVLPPIRSRRAVLALALLAGLFCVAAMIQTAGNALAAQHREDLAEKQRFRQQACACQTVECAKRVARSPAFGDSSASDDAQQAQIDGWLCLSRFSYTCTLGDLLKDLDDETMRSLRERWLSGNKR
ncbi:MAG TPA: hypothetical protein VK698_26485 [Kofleriaceae bacterium]|nr:hypothetical protein [Kofleriaceae bacterium]